MSVIIIIKTDSLEPAKRLPAGMKRNLSLEDDDEPGGRPALFDDDGCGRATGVVP